MKNRIIIGIAIVASLASFYVITIIMTTGIHPVDAASCDTYPIGSAVDSRFAPPYNLVSGYKGVNITPLSCSTGPVSLIIGNNPLDNITDYSSGGDDAAMIANYKKMIVAKRVYIYSPGSTTWKPLTDITSPFNSLFNSTIDANWDYGQIKVNVGTLVKGTHYVLGYSCVRKDGAWKCGCKNAECTQEGWQIQKFTVSGVGGGSVEFKMDADGPGPMPPQEGTVSSKLLMLRSFTAVPYDTGNYYYHTGVPITPRVGEGPYDCIITSDKGQRCGVTAFVDSSYVADLSWSSDAPSCTLSQKLAKNDKLSPATFNFTNLPGTGRARVLIPRMYGTNVTGYTVSSDPEYTINCGGVQKSITATFPPIAYVKPPEPPLGSNPDLELIKIKEARYNTFIADGGKSIISAELAVGPAKVDARAVVSATRTSAPPGCQGGQCGAFIDMVLGDGPMMNMCIGTFCQKVFVYTSMNAPACAFDGLGGNPSEIGPHLYKIWAFITTESSYLNGSQTVICGTAFDTVN